MKIYRMITAMAVLMGAALLTVGEPAHAATLRCSGADGKSACTAGQLSALNTALASGKRMHKPMLIEIQSFSWGMSQGTIACKQTNGSDCTESQLDAVTALASTTNSPEGAIHITKEIDKSSPMLMDKAVTSPSKGLRCAGADGKSACTLQQVSELNEMIVTGKRMHKPFLTDVDSVSLGSNGSLVCRKAGGEVCDDGNLNAIMSLSSSNKNYTGHVTLMK